MAKSINNGLNSLLTSKVDSVNSNFDLKTLRTTFDSNYEKWKSLSPGDPQRQILATENEKIIGLILAGC